ncbi:PRC and DUF2382 domain-containing protein [Deinococcus yavapaiensis]|uniref:Uncharacterized protein (TIGR02271 family) n=1 Tax=Deinococcus yavapaiensis KR-236 TaxID=694435 RepID=A0A318RYT6_9DEIO|nr:DUF2382 domain-containing protein [Deinococcus yavapaiensis]PYE48389.1 uncharacterized protein (TIGR02271 family) [Deinococcus yavapaiensis KR-236]
MANLIPLSDLVRDRNYDFRSEGIYDPTGSPAYGANGQKVGTIRGAMAEPDSGRLRYLVVDVGGWFTSKEVLVPVGLARIEDDAVYFDTLTKDQVKAMQEYRNGQDYGYDAQLSDERVLRGSDVRNDTMTMGTSSDTTLSSTERAGSGLGTVSTDSSMGVASGTTGMAAQTYNYRDEDTADALFKTPQRLRLLEERLLVDKERYHAGSVEVGKRVETRTEQVPVSLTREEIIIERHPVTNPTPVDGNVQLGAGNETIRVDLEAERAEVRKQAFVTEEVTIGEREVSQTQTFTETVGREVLDVNRTGGVDVRNDSLETGTVTRRDDRNLLEKTGDALEDGIDRIDGKTDRNR